MVRERRRVGLCAGVVSKSHRRRDAPIAMDAPAIPLSTPSPRPVVPLPTEPFRGIQPFRFCDKAIFSEHREQAVRLGKMITIYRGTLLVGGQGTGKSSLINAGLLPGLLDEGWLPERV